jgi:hypothetical protein
LAPEVLWWHKQCGESWQRPNDPLIPLKVFDEIEEALESIYHSKRNRLDKLNNCIQHAVPSIVNFDNLIRDAWDTLSGDLSAAERYKDFLELICAESKQQCCCNSSGSYSQFIDGLFVDREAACDSEVCCIESSEEEPCPSEPVCNDEKPEPLCPCKKSVITKDKAAILLMAVLHVSCQHQATAKRYLLSLLDQFCRLEFLGSLHRSAIKALCGDKASSEHFRDLLEVLVEHCECGFCCCETCLDESLADCLRDMVANWCSIECYRVTDIIPPQACPGETIKICGTGFGKQPGHIQFREKGGLGPGPMVSADRWCDSQIEVEIPNGAGCGLTPLLPLQTIRVCDGYMEYRPTGCMEQQFIGTSPEILKFRVKGHTQNECLTPGEPLKIRWNSCAADRVVVEIRNRKTGVVIAIRDPAEPRGSWDFLATNFTETIELQIRIQAFGKCSPAVEVREINFVFQNPPQLSVDGMEVTQAIQYYGANQHLTDAADRGMDNSLQLVTNKTAWVRVYLRSGQNPAFDGGALHNVDGSLTVERRVGGLWSQVAVLASQNGPFSAQESYFSYDAERGNINNSLNFVVPANLMTGLLRFRVDLSSPYKQCPGNRATDQVTVDVNLTQTLNAAFITIGYNGPNSSNTGNLNLPAPTIAQCQAETSWAMTTYPVSGAPNVRIAGTFTTNTPLNDPRSCPGCCSPNWQPLLLQVASLVVADQAATPGENWVYYGIVNNGIPVNVPGCNGWGATGGLAGRPVTYAHEIGHQFGLPHARCGNAGAGNANYPVYEPYDLPVDVPANPINSTNWTMASIGEYGLDINNGNIANPQNAEDFMSYCSPRWISLYTHNYLINRTELTPQVIATGSGAVSERVISDDEPGFIPSSDKIQPMIDILGVIQDGEIEVSSVARLETRYLLGSGRMTSYQAQLLDQGVIIATDALFAFESEGCNGKSAGCGDCDDCAKPTAIFFRAMLEDVTLGDCLRIVDATGKVVWQRQRPEEPSQLLKVRSIVDKRSQAIKLTWQHKLSKGLNSDVWLRWSNDEGKHWHALSVGLKESSVLLDPENLPSGEVVFQVMAHDGFTTTIEQTTSISVAPKPPQVTILYPTESSKNYAERQLHLWGVASLFEGMEIADEAYKWYLNDELVAKGQDVWIDNPGQGNYELRLSVVHQGLTGSAIENIEIV